MAYTAGNLHLRAAAPGEQTYIYNATTNGASDTLAEILIAGYFNNSDDDLNLVVDDMIHCRATDGNMMVRVSAVSSGSVTCQFAGGNLPPQTPSTGTGGSDARLLVGDYEIASSLSTATHYMLPTPYPGAEVRVNIQSSGTEILHFDCGGATNVVFNARGDRRIRLLEDGEFFHVVGVSTTRWRIAGIHFNGSAISEGGTVVFLSSTHV